MVYKHAISTIVPAKSVRMVYSSFNPYHQNSNEDQDDNVDDVHSDELEAQENEGNVNE